jgi:hypothetical protein
MARPQICDWCGGTAVEWTSNKIPTEHLCGHCNGTGWAVADDPPRHDDRGTAEILGIGIPTLILIGILVFVDIRYNHAAAVHGIGDLVRSILPQNTTSQQAP